MRLIDSASMRGGFGLLRYGLGSLVVALLAAGCVAIGRQYEHARLQTDKLADVHIGETTKADILTRFGAPTVIQRRDIEGLLSSLAVRYQGQDLNVKLDPALFDDIYIYEYRRVNRVIVFLGVFSWVQSVDKSDRLLFFFNPDGTVAGVGLTEGTKEL
jgi:hypothetical protein